MRDNLLTWVSRRCRTAKGEELDFFDHQYLADIYKDDSREIVIQKSAQTGLTTYGINKALWFGDNHNVSIIYTFPTSSDVSEFSKARVKPTIQASSYLLDRIADVDAVELKQIGLSFIYFRGTWSEREAISIDADMLIHDETDRSKPQVISQYRERLSHSKYRYIINMSNPSIPDYGVNAMYLKSDMKKWFVTCPNCEREQVMRFPDSINTKGEVYYKCLHCGARLDDDVRRKGKWKPTNEGAKVSGYHISQLMAPWISAEEVLQKFEKEKWKQTFYNFVLGEPYSGENVPIKRTDMLECIQAGREIQTVGRYTYMGVDQGDELHVTIWQKEGKIKKLLYLGIKKDFEELPDLMVNYGVISCVIDALPNKHSARRFQLQFPGKVWLCYYNDSQKEHIKWHENVEEKEYHVTVHRTEVFDLLTDEYKSKNVVLPKLTEDIETFIRHHCALAKEKVEKPDGTYVFSYIATGADHFAHSANYGMIALSRAVAGSLAEVSNKPTKDNKPITSGLLDERF